MKIPYCDCIDENWKALKARIQASLTAVKLNGKTYYQTDGTGICDLGNIEVPSKASEITLDDGRTVEKAISDDESAIAGKVDAVEITEVTNGINMTVTTDTSTKQSVVFTVDDSLAVTGKTVGISDAIDARITKAQNDADTAQATAEDAQTDAENAMKAATTAQTAADTAKANAATAQATAVTAQATAETALEDAETAQNTADTAVANAKTAQTTADKAVANAATAQTTANNAMTKASNAQTDASTAITKADTAQTTADTAIENAKTAQDTADTAVATANTAKTNAESAVSTANSASSTASTAYQTAVTAKTTAETADANADDALEKATSAVSTANSASSTASTAYQTAVTAKTTAETAEGKADNAQTDATTAITNAATAQTTANNAQTTATNAESEAKKGIQNINYNVDTTNNTLDATLQYADSDSVKTIFKAGNNLSWNGNTLNATASESYNSFEFARQDTTSATSALRFVAQNAETGAEMSTDVFQLGDNLEWDTTSGYNILKAIGGGGATSITTVSYLNPSSAANKMTVGDYAVLDNTANFNDYSFSVYLPTKMTLTTGTYGGCLNGTAITTAVTLKYMMIKEAFLFKYGASNYRGIAICCVKTQSANYDVSLSIDGGDETTVSMTYGENGDYRYFVGYIADSNFITGTIDVPITYEGTRATIPCLITATCPGLNKGYIFHVE